MKNLLKMLILCSLVCILVLPAAAWDDTGHKVSAYVAWQQLTPETRQKVFELLVKAPEDSDLSVFYNAFDSRSDAVKKLELFMIAATWPDIVRNRDFKMRFEKYNHSNWHYADIFWQQDGNQARILENFPEESGKAIPQLYESEKTLRNPAASPGEKAVALAWFLHLGGDIHNPLHNASRVTELEPKGDQGGNMFLFTPADGPPQNRVNLHYFWDSLITRNIVRTNDACDSYYIPQVGSKIIKEYPKSKFADRIEPGNFTAWHKEGFTYLSKDVYASNIRRNEMPPQAYEKSSFKLGMQQLALAGYRMGATLNRIFSDELAKSDECQIIRRVMYPISKRPTMNQESRVALVNICPENRGMVARPTTTIIVDGEPVMFEYDVVKVFDTVASARAYAAEHGIKDSQF